MPQRRSQLENYDCEVPIAVPIPPSFRVPERLGLPSSKTKDSHGRFSSRDRQGQVKLASDYQMKYQSARRSGSITAAASAALGMAILYENTLELSKSIQWLDVVLTACLDGNITPEIVSALSEISHNSLSIIYDHLGEYNKAVFHSKHHRKFASTPHSRIIALSNEGCFHRKLGNITEAFDKHYRGLDEAKDLQASKSISMLHAQLAHNSLVNDVKLDQQITNHCEEHFNSESKMGDKASRLQANSLMGLTAEKNHDYNKAIMVFGDALDVSLAMNNQNAARNAKVHIGFNKGNALLRQRLKQAKQDGEYCNVIKALTTGK